jgi:outer membrane putative beta-barrel porin/alpha-amylase
MMRRLSLALLLCTPLAAAASCGAAFCTINTNWDIQGAWMEPAPRLDLRYEYIKQDQPQSGSQKISLGQIPRHHDEVLTKNQNWLASFDYPINQDWAVNALLPVVDRQHTHIHNHMGAQLLESWDFNKIGDARILARRRLATFEDAEPALGTLGVNFGVKLPTGRTDVRNADDELAERTLQPGTGTTDLLAGAYYSKLLPARSLSWFVQGLFQVPLNSHDEYRPGQRLSLDAGVRYAVGDHLGLMLQANALIKGRDSGNQAEPDDTGGRSLFLSPGVSYAVTPALQIYGFVQLPVYQYVNGVQLTARHAVAIGITSRF